jgi:hypothetical protein
VGFVLGGERRFRRLQDGVCIERQRLGVRVVGIGMKRCDAIVLAVHSTAMILQGRAHLSMLNYTAFGKIIPRKTRGGDNWLFS